MKKVLVIKGVSNAEVLRLATDQVAQGFINKGYEILVLDLLNDQEYDIFLTEMKKKDEYAFVFAMQCLEIGNVICGEPFLKAMKISNYIGWIFDDIMYHYFRIFAIEKANDVVHLFSVDAAAREIVSWIAPNVQHVGHILHGGFENQQILQKDIDILFAGNFGSEPVIEDMIPNISSMPILKKIVNDSLTFLLNEGCALSVREGIKEVLASYGEEWEKQIHYELSAEGVIGYIEQYIRHYYRKQILEDLLEAGFGVSVVGTGYEKMKEEWGDALTIYGKQNIQEVVELMAKSKIICNPFPPVFKEGAHERIFSAMLNRACCLTPYSEYQDHLFGEYVMFYRINDSITMQRQVKNFLENYDVWMQEKAEKIYQYAKENHTWEKRGEQIIDYYEKNIEHH